MPHAVCPNCGYGYLTERGCERCEWLALEATLDPRTRLVSDILRDEGGHLTDGFGYYGNNQEFVRICKRIADSLAVVP